MVTSGISNHQSFTTPTNHVRHAPDKCIPQLRCFKLLILLFFSAHHTHTHIYTALNRNLPAVPRRSAIHQPRKQVLTQDATAFKRGMFPTLSQHLQIVEHLGGTRCHVLCLRDEINLPS